MGIKLSQNTREKFNYWLQNARSDSSLRKELKQVEQDLIKAREANDNSKIEELEADIEERFYRDLDFGTGGLRGIIGAGTNRMNHYTVARATQGLADYIKSHSKRKNQSIAVAYDSRNKSSRFAKVVARVMAENGIKCRLFRELMPTPILSYAVRKFECDAGVMITASHNPAPYNGYKAYGADGCQLSLEASEAVIKRISKLDMFTDVKLADYDEAFDKGLITHIGKEFISEYFNEVKKQSIRPNVFEGSGLKVVFTPLNGAGNKPVRRLLTEVGVADVIVVPEQEEPDGNFPTCPYPNPEFKEALELGVKLAQVEEADLLLATDPDADRVGIAVRNGKGQYCLFSGNEVGAMLLEYICRERKAQNNLPLQPIAVKSIVSTAIADKIAAKYGVQMVDTLTGFKFIAGIAGDLEKKGEEHRFIYGFEESYGYLAGSYVRDKDAVSACMLICEMAAFYRKNGSSLIEARTKMYEEYGYYHHHTDNLAFEGSAGMKQMTSIMDGVRKHFCKPTTLNGLTVITFTDYQEKKITKLKGGTSKPTGLPRSNVVKLVLEDGSVVIVRPSGTEPKLKVYYTCIGDSHENSVALQEKIGKEFLELINFWK
ncbi:MAG: phospho-sugar mutase [Oscillospiraceae bacterium]|nr:phospho-sugar mutase [Oscillospiraceae bacterium]